MEQKIPANFIYPDITERHYRFGLSPLPTTPLRIDGDWRDYLPPPEDQNVRGIESSACFVEAQEHSIATLEEEQFDEKNQNYSARFNALLAGGTQFGGDPLRAADSFRHDGLVDDSDMPFGDSIQSWSDFHSWMGVNEPELRAKGKTYLEGKTLANDIVFERWEVLEAKRLKLREALKYSPCPISVAAWYTDENGKYYKPLGTSDQHLVLAVYMNADNEVYIWDTYAPYLKVLRADFNFDFCMRWSVKKNLTPPNTTTILDQLAKILQNLLYLMSTYKMDAPLPVMQPLPQHVSKIKPWSIAIKHAEGNSISHPNTINNNPWNVKYSPYTKTLGALPGHPATDGGIFARFLTYTAGEAAICQFLTDACNNQLRSYHDVTLDQFTTIYACPPNKNYVRAIAKEINVLPSIKIKELL